MSETCWDIRGEYNGKMVTAMGTAWEQPQPESMPTNLSITMSKTADQRVQQAPFNHM